jgi:glyoxylase-like metal-dependent hydrolase (beta-lactamase superfamily II)
MNEIAPGIFHWTVEHPDIHIEVSSHYVAPARLLIDPLEPAEGMGFFDGLGEPPSQVVLTSGLHWRHADRFRDRYGASVRAPAAAARRYQGGDRVFEPYEDGEELAPGVTAIEVGGIAPDDFALHIEHGAGALAIADAVIRYGGEIGFVPDNLWDDPRAEQAAVRDSLRGLLARDFDILLFAHGEPLPEGGRAALERFVA